MSICRKKEKERNVSCRIFRFSVSFFKIGSGAYPLGPRAQRGVDSIPSHKARAMKTLFWALAAWAALSLAVFAAVMQTMT
jgi:hypothetical protein